MKYTPGPWSAERGIVDLHVWCGLDGAFSKRGMNDQKWDFSERDFANARLLAAAPDLLEALVSLLPVAADADPSRWSKLSERIAAARAAIFKATGE